MEQIQLKKKHLIVFGDVLREMRAERQISQVNLAKKMKTQQPYISELESNNCVPSLGTLISYLDGIGCDIYIVPRNGF